MTEPTPRLRAVGPYIGPAPASRLEQWLPFASGFAVVVLCIVEWHRRRWQ